MSLLLRDGVVYFLVRFSMTNWQAFTEFHLKVVAILSIASGISWMILPDASSSDRIYLFVYLNWTIFST